jgi:hypothetical protein
MSSTRTASFSWRWGAVPSREMRVSRFAAIDVGAAPRPSLSSDVRDIEELVRGGCGQEESALSAFHDQTSLTMDEGTRCWQHARIAASSRLDFLGALYRDCAATRNKGAFLMRRIGMNHCPYCGKDDALYSSRPETWRDELCLFVFLQVVNCHCCMRRHYRPLFWPLVPMQPRRKPVQSTAGYKGQRRA